MVRPIASADIAPDTVYLPSSILQKLNISLKHVVEGSSVESNRTFCRIDLANEFTFLSVEEASPFDIDDAEDIVVPKWLLNCCVGAQRASIEPLTELAHIARKITCEKVSQAVFFPTSAIDSEYTDWIDDLKAFLVSQRQPLQVGSLFAVQKDTTVVFRVTEIDSGSSTQLSPSLIFITDESSILEIQSLNLTRASLSNEPEAYSNQFQQLSSMVQIALIQNDLYSRLGIVPSKSILVTGSTGVGKSHLINAVLSSARIQSFRVNALSLALWLYKMDQLGNSITDDTICPLRKAINRARSSSPAVVILEDLHIVSDDLACVDVDFGLCISRISSEIKRMADDSCVIATCRETEKLPIAFKRRGPDAIFQTQIMLEVPSSSTRKSIAKELLTAASYLLDSSDPSIANLKGDAVHQYSHRIAEATPGFVARDIKNLITRASAHARLRRMNDTNLENITEQLQELKLSSSNNFPPLSWSQDFLKVLNCINASQAVDTGFDMSKTDLKWENIGGYEKVKSKLKTLVINPLENPQAYQRLKVKPPSGILLYGPSGCGKTLLAKTLGSNSPMNFISVNGSKIFSKYLGESEATVRRIFELARKLAPCIIFFDEIDILGVRREWSEDGASGVNERVLSTLLNEMDGVAEQKGVIVIGSTNRPEKLDDALLRPGRLDQHIYVPMPSHEDRAAILDSLLSRITSNVDVTRVANVTDGLSPADLVVLIREAKYLLMRGNDPDLAVLEWKHIAAALSGALKGPLTEVFEKSCEVDTDEPEVDEKQAAFWNSFGGNIEGTWGVTAFQQTAAEAAEMHAVLSSRIKHETKDGAAGAWWRPGGVSDEDLGKYAKFAKGSKK